MKNFLKNVLAVMVGILLMQMIGGLIFLSTLVGSLVGGQSNVVIPTSNAGLKIDMSRIQLNEYSYVENPFAGLSMGGFNNVDQINIFDAVRAINDAAGDPAIQYIYLKPDGAAGGMARLEELRNALVEFRKSGKPVIAYMDNATNASYFLATAADKIYFNYAEGTSNQVVGFSARLIFIKDVLDLLGVEMQLIRHGKYKSAGEMYIKNNISKENYEQNKAYIDGIWNAWSKKIAASRGISQEKFNSYVNNLTLVDGRDYYEAGLVDGLFTREKMKERLLTFHKEGTKQLQFVSLGDYVTVHKQRWALAKAANTVAVIYANGQIVDGQTSGEAIVGDELAKLIAEVCADSTITSVVFRVNSPGGSVLASDKIRLEMDRLCKTKHVVASYGDYAASGGYWISANCDYIVSNHSTLTGSIGVFSMVPNFSRSLREFKVGYVTINSNDHSDMFSGTKHFDATEEAFMQKSVDSIYDKFTSIVAKGRDKSKSYIDEIAQGRVWAGDDAKKIGLVDTMGDLKHAVVLAASKGNPEVQFSDIRIVEYPKAVTGLEAMMVLLNTPQDNEVLLSKVKDTPLETVCRAFTGVLETTTTAKVYAQLPFYIDIR